MNKKEIITKLVNSINPARPQGSAFAPSNIALCKYWGKRNAELNLPVTSSLSVSLGKLGTTTGIALCESSDEFYLNGTVLEKSSSFAVKLTAFLDLFRMDGIFYKVETENNIPTAAGLASSASGFAALVLALNDLYGWDLPGSSLSILARLGSGSACRSVYNGFVKWNAGVSMDGMDSFAEPLASTWQGLCVGVIKLTEREKPTSSRDAMSSTVTTSTLYKKWPEKAAKDLLVIETAIRAKDFELLGRTAESNALAMHATMIDTWPPVLYWLPETIAVFHKIWELRQNGLVLYFTIDAGPNVKLLFLEKEEAEIVKIFKDVEIIKPFGIK